AREHRRTAPASDGCRAPYTARGWGGGGYDRGVRDAGRGCGAGGGAPIVRVASALDDPGGTSGVLGRDDPGSACERRALAGSSAVCDECPWLAGSVGDMRGRIGGRRMWRAGVGDDALCVRSRGPVRAPPSALVVVAGHRWRVRRGGRFDRSAGARRGL